MTNHGGCAILNEMITYPDRKETRKKFQKTGMPWWSNEKANLLLVPIFSAMDGTVLYSIMEECFLQSALMSIVMAFGVAVVLNILPLVIAKFLHGAIYKDYETRINNVCCIRGRISSCLWWDSVSALRI